MCVLPVLRQVSGALGSVQLCWLVHQRWFAGELFRRKTDVLIRSHQQSCRSMATPLGLSGGRQGFPQHRNRSGDMIVYAFGVAVTYCNSTHQILRVPACSHRFCRTGPISRNALLFLYRIASHGQR